MTEGTKLNKTKTVKIINEQWPINLFNLIGNIKYNSYCKIQIINIYNKRKHVGNNFNKLNFINFIIRIIFLILTLLDYYSG